MKILLIYPEYPDTFWSFKYALKFIHRRAALPPIGLLTIGAMLPKEWSKKVVDLNVTKLTERDLAWADCAFIGGMVVQKNRRAKSSPGASRRALRSLQAGRSLPSNQMSLRMWTILY